MRWLVVVLLTSLWAPALGAAAEKPLSFRFGAGDVGKLPAGWKAEKTGKGEGSVWKVVADKTAPSGTGYVLAQTAEGPNPLFNLCVAQGPTFKDVELTVAFKAVKGKLDQGGGLVWRYQDANNYYIARMNPLEDNYRLYRVVAGKRTQFAGKEGVKIPAGEWHRLKVRQVGKRIECYLDGQKLFEGSDDTFAQAGQVGLWSKADAQTYFAAFEAHEVKSGGP